MQEHTIDGQLRWASAQLQQTSAATDSPQLDSKLLLCHVLNCELIYLHTWPEKSLSAEQLAQFAELVARRKLGQPIAYLIGYRHFWSLRLAVCEATLIPRPETELLIETALALPLDESAKVMDLGTGTGAIALALACENPTWQVKGIDKHAEAVELAKRNAMTNNIHNVDFQQSDWFSAISDDGYQLIVSNPPYVEAQSPYLAQGDVRFEPLSALVSGSDGLDDIRLIVAQAPRYLASFGWLIIEHGFNQASDIALIFTQHGFQQVRCLADLNGVPRLTLGQYCHDMA
jgi:release factor glutamine methyltransferase